MRSLSLFLLFSGLLLAAGELSNRRAPGFSIVDAAMQQHDLADYRGSFVIIEFMQTGCPHCIKFGEILEQSMAKYRGKLQALSIVLPPDNLDSVRAYIQRHGVTIPVMFDCGQVAASYMKLTPSTPKVSFPHAFLVDPQGKIVNDWAYGPATLDIFEGAGLAAELDRVLSGKK